MYQAHFGLKKPLFESGIAQEAFLAPKHELIIANTKIALTTLDSAVVLTGTAGVGKTTLISSALRTTNTRLALGWLTGAAANGADLLELLLVEFGLNAHRVGRVERMQMWRQFRSEMSATESRVFVIVERADDLSHEVLRALDSLTTADPNGCPGANLVLLGQPALLEHLKSPLLESLRQRIRLRERLEPLTADELRAYLAHQATRAGVGADRIFAPNAADTLHELSGGIARIVNNLCETALTLAATGNESVITPELLKKTAVAMFGVDSPAASAAPATATPISESAPSAVPAIAPAPAAARIRDAVPARDALAPANAAAPATPILMSATFGAPSAIALTPPSAPTYTPTPPRPQSERVIGRASIVAPTIFATAPPPPHFAAAAPPVENARQQPPPAPRANAAPVAARAADSPLPRVMQERVLRPPPQPTPQPSFPPVIPSRVSSPAARSEADTEIDSFADTLTDTPDVQMPDLPVLTDAVEPLARPERPRARAEMAYTRPEAAPAPAARGPIVNPPRPALSGTRPAQPASSAASLGAAAKPAAPAAATRPASPPKPSAEPNAGAEQSEEDLLHQTQTVRALAAAKSIDDISSSMAETLFGESDLDMLSAALGAAGWPDASLDAGSGAKAAAKAEPKKALPVEPKAEDDPFDLFGLGPDAPLELIDDSAPTDEHGRKAATHR
jgi:general secretion pathway protein A